LPSGYDATRELRAEKNKIDIPNANRVMIDNDTELFLTIFETLKILNKDS
jgi:hypothetical protein